MREEGHLARGERAGRRGTMSAPHEPRALSRIPAAAGCASSGPGAALRGAAPGEAAGAGSGAVCRRSPAPGCRRGSPSDVPLAPPYGRWLGGLFAVFGPVLLPVKLVQAGLLLLAGLLLRGLLVAAGIRPPAALLATGLLLCDPQLAAFAHYLWPEILHLFLSLLGVFLMLVPGPRPTLRCLAAGASFGLALLAKSLLGPFVPVLAVAAACAPAGLRSRQRLARGAAVALGTLLLTAPVAVRNGLAHGTWSISNSALLKPLDRHQRPRGSGRLRLGGAAGGRRVPALLALSRASGAHRALADRPQGQ